MGAIKRDATDKAFSAAIRESADYLCQRCGCCFRHNPGAFDCSHIKSRQYKSTRYYRLNALALCRSCHSVMAKSPIDHIELVKRVHGEEGYQTLLDFSNSRTRLSKADALWIRKHWKAEHERCRMMRMQGVQGQIVLLDWVLP
jgi:hypothetical protein